MTTLLRPLTMRRWCGRTRPASSLIAAMDNGRTSSPSAADDSPSSSSSSVLLGWWLRPRGAGMPPPCTRRRLYTVASTTTKAAATTKATTMPPLVGETIWTVGQDVGRPTHRRASSSPSSGPLSPRQGGDNNDNNNSGSVRQQTTAYRLLYFDTRGAAEPIRYLMAICNIHYRDVRYPIRPSAGGFGVDGAFLSHKGGGYFRSNLGRLPVLQILERRPVEKKTQKEEGGGNTTMTTTTTAAVEEEVVAAEIGQTHAILRYLADRHGAMGDTPLERAHIDAFVESLRDVKTAWYRAKRGGAAPATISTTTAAAEAGGTGAGASPAPTAALPPSPHQSKKDFLAVQLPEWCLKLEESLPPKEPQRSADGTTASASTPWLIGDRPSLADVCLYAMLSTPTSLMTGSSQSFFDGASADVVQRSYGPGTIRTAADDRTASATVSPPRCPRIFESIQATSRLGAVRQWEDRRPDTFN
jgi:glutathione S-transferase